MDNPLKELDRGTSLPLLIEHIHQIFLSIPNDKRPKHPVSALVKAWHERSRLAQHETRGDKRLLPVVETIGFAPERERGVLFGGLLDGREAADFPLFPEIANHRLRVPMLEIYDATGAPVRNRGKGAPIEARLIIRSFLMVRKEDRHLITVRVKILVKELLDGLYPRKDRQAYRPAEKWPGIEGTLRSARDYCVTDAGNGRWFPLALRRLPGIKKHTKKGVGLPDDDDYVLLDIALPTGADAGPSVDLPYLDEQGLVSGPAYFSYLAARSLIWLPGKTRRKGAPPRGSRWGWSSNPTDYPVLTYNDLRRFAFGEGDRKHRNRAEVIKPWRSLPDVAFIPDAVDRMTRVRGWRLIPTEAMEAIQRATGKDNPTEAMEAVRMAPSTDTPTTQPGNITT